MCHRCRTFCGQNTKRGGSPSYYIYLYKTYGNLFLHGLVFVSNLQWISKKTQQQQQQQLYTANIANQVTPLILRGQSYVVF